MAVRLRRRHPASIPAQRSAPLPAAADLHHPHARRPRVWTTGVAGQPGTVRQQQRRHRPLRADPLEGFLSGSLRGSSTRIGYPLQVHRSRPAAESGAVLFEDEDLRVRCTPLIHRVPAYAYRVDQKPLAGRFDVTKAKELGIPPGPIYAQLKRGETVELDDGRVIDGRHLCGPDRDGVSIVYCTDTVFSEAAVELARGADLLIHESTFAHEEADMAFQKQHSTSTMAAQTAAEAGVGRLVLTHLSPRYAPGNAVTADDLLAEAQAIFPNTVLAKDFMRLDVKARCNSS